MPIICYPVCHVLTSLVVTISVLIQMNLMFMILVRKRGPEDVYFYWYEKLKITVKKV